MRDKFLSAADASKILRVTPAAIRLMVKRRANQSEC